MKTVVQTEQAPTAIGPYSQAIAFKDLVFLSGQIGLSPSTGDLVSADVLEQAKQAFANLEAVCRAAGTDLNHLLKLNIYLTDLSSFTLINDLMSTYFTKPYPARATIGVASLPKAALIEVDGIAVLMS